VLSLMATVTRNRKHKKNPSSEPPVRDESEREEERTRARKCVRRRERERRTKASQRARTVRDGWCVDRQQFFIGFQFPKLTTMVTSVSVFTNLPPKNPTRPYLCANYWECVFLNCYTCSSYLLTSHLFSFLPSFLPTGQTKLAEWFTPHLTKLSLSATTEIGY